MVLLPGGMFSTARAVQNVGHQWTSADNRQQRSILKDFEAVPFRFVSWDVGSQLP